MSRDHCPLLLCDVTARALRSNGPSANIENTVPVLLAACVLRALCSNGRCLQIHCLATGLYDTIFYTIPGRAFTDLHLSLNHILYNSGHVTFADMRTTSLRESH
jgi:hypothetical protein